MLKKLTRTDTPIRLPLMCDSDFAEMQMEAARQVVEETLNDKNEERFLDEVLRTIRATVGESEAFEVVKSFEVSLQMLIERNIRPKQLGAALDRLREAMKLEESREAIAYVRAQISIHQYRDSSDTEDLLIKDFADVAHIKVKALTPDQRRAAERAAGPKPRHGTVLAARSYDVMRKAQRDGEDGTIAHAVFMSTLTDEEQEQVTEFEAWSSLVDREVLRLGCLAVDGFDLPRLNGLYDVEGLLEVCVEAEEVISEGARHIRNISTLGKSVSLCQSLASGTGEQGAAETQLETDGNVDNASIQAEST